MTIYRFLKFGTREETPFSSIEEALKAALEDINSNRAAPLEIEEDGKVVLRHTNIREQFEQKLDKPTSTGEALGRNKN